MTDGRTLYPFRPVVYIAGPYSKPDPCENTHTAVAVANRLVDACAPLIPHLSHFWHTMTPRPYEFWLDLDLQFLRKCDAVLRFDGESSGADKEIVWAERWGIPVFYDEASLRTWIAALPRDANAYRAGFNAALAWVLERFNLDTEDEDALRDAIENGPWE